MPTTPAGWHALAHTAYLYTLRTILLAIVTATPYVVGNTLEAWLFQ